MLETSFSSLSVKVATVFRDTLGYGVLHNLLKVQPVPTGRALEPLILMACSPVWAYFVPHYTGAGEGDLLFQEFNPLFEWTLVCVAGSSPHSSQLAPGVELSPYKSMSGDLQCLEWELGGGRGDVLSASHDCLE